MTNKELTPVQEIITELDMMAEVFDKSQFEVATLIMDKLKEHFLKHDFLKMEKDVIVQSYKAGFKAALTGKDSESKKYYDEHFNHLPK